MPGIIRNLELESIQQVFSLLGKCTDDYLFILDFEKDEFTISSNALKRFALDKTRFDNAGSVINKVCYPDDREALIMSLEEIQTGRASEHNMEYRWMGHDGHPYWVHCQGQAVLDGAGNTRYLIGCITELGRKNVIDNLTGLYREIKLSSDLALIQAREGKVAYLLQIGIDNFREINEKYGKRFGDQVLIDVCECIKRCVREDDIVYRMGGDEMLVLSRRMTEEADPAKELYQRIRRTVDEAIFAGGYQHFYTISAGSAYYDESVEENPLKLLEKTEFALHQAKEKGKNTYVRYEKKDYEDFIARLDLQERLRQSVDANFRGFELYYQPIINVKKKRILGAEALLRWKDDVLGMLSPAVFIPLLEESGLIIPLGRWIIHTALSQCQKWQEREPEFRININISFIQIRKSNLLSDIEEYMEELSFDRKNVLFEVTESGELEEGGNAADVLQNFQKNNLNLAIDDFGTGYSNLRYIKDMMFDLVKIDQSFIRNITNSQYDYLVVKQFTELAHSLNLKVCYEGVETEEDLKRVLELDPDYIQGFYFAKPVPKDVFEERYLCKDLEF
ncbi:MAG: EAL domain-containing protein [Lachnospiraceae bacterium]|nr:EAL domain-containing protein [Lachnospiraceae bacterium]